MAQLETSVLLIRILHFMHGRTWSLYFLFLKVVPQLDGRFHTLLVYELYPKSKQVNVRVVSCIGYVRSLSLGLLSYY